jgi:hypothetical protein
MPTKIYKYVDKLAITLEGKSHEFKIYNGKDLLLVSRDHHSSTNIAGAHLDGDPRQ